MSDMQVLLLTRKHILSGKLYEVLGRDCKVSLLPVDDVIKGKTKLYCASFYGKDHVVFCTEFLWELLSSIDATGVTKFFNQLFSISGTEDIKVTYVSMRCVLEEDYLKMSPDKYAEFQKIADYVASATAASSLNNVIEIPSVYGISEEEDIIDLARNNRVSPRCLSGLDAPMLADKVALYVSGSLCRACGEEAAFPRRGLLEWLQENDSGAGSEDEDMKIRSCQEHCVFDLVYKKEANAHYRGRSVAQVRMEIGRKLSSRIPEGVRERLDYVTPVPRTGLYYAMGLSDGLSVPYRQALIKQTYQERSFSISSSDERKKFLWKKINAIPELIKGKSIAVVDEAIFTGMTLKVVCQMLWECDAKEIFLCIPTPPCRHHCRYLVQPPRKMLLEYMSMPYLKEYFNVTDIFFQDEAFFRDYNRELDDDVCLECFYGVNEDE